MPDKDTQKSLLSIVVDRFVHPDEFKEYAEYGRKLGFTNIWSGPMVRSSYHADRQYEGKAL